MLYFLSILPFILTLYIEFKAKSPFLIFSISIGALYFLSVPVVSGNYPEWVDFQVQSIGFIFFLSYLFGRFTFFNIFKIKFNEKKLQISDIKLMKKISALLLLMSVILSMYTFSFDINKMLYSNWSEYRMDATGLEVVVTYLYISGASFLCFSILDKDKKGGVISLLCLSYFIFVLKSRGYIISMVVPILIYWVTFTKIDIRKIIIVISTISTIAFLYIFTRYIRWAGSLDNFSLSDFTWSNLVGDDLGELQLIEVLYKIILLNDLESLKISPFSSIQRVLFFPIDQIVKISPRDISNIVWDYYIGVYGVNGSYHTTVISESYLNSRYAGPIVFPIFISFIFSIFDKIFENKPTSIIFSSGIICYASMAIARGSSYNGFIVLFICTAFIFIIYRLFLKWKF